MLRFPPVEGRIVFIDTEFTTLDRDCREVWEIGAVVRDPGQPDREVEWQIRPSLTGASPDSLRIAGYYRRNRVAGQHVGATYLVVHPEHGEDETQLDAKHRHGYVEEVAFAVAEMLDGAFIVNAVPTADEIALHRFLAGYGQALTSHWRVRCVETLALGYLYGRAAELDTQNPAGPAGAELRAAIPPPPWDPRVLTELVGVPLIPDHLVHRALVDARQARDVFDAITGRTAPMTTTGSVDT